MKKVLVGMSGGVDSSVSALLLKEKGYEVVGVKMNLFNNNADDMDARTICDKLNIEYYSIDLNFQFKTCIINYFIDEYSNCKTPNPCVECNKKFKFGTMYEFAKSKGIDYIATGHYAKVVYSEKYDRYILCKADNKLKDQSYFLYGIKKEVLPYVIFPLSGFSSKDEIRDIARKNKLATASKSDSQDICFIPSGNYKNFLEGTSNFKPNKGDIILGNKVVGQHNGLYKYTIGQRKGLGISHETPLYVIGFNKSSNALIVGEEKDLYVLEFKVKDFNLLLMDSLDLSMKVNVKTRYKSIENSATISMDGNFIKVIFDVPQKGVTSGQSAVFYIDDIVVGGGIIV